MRRGPLRRATCVAGTLAALLGALPVFAVGTQRVALRTADDFEGGKLDGTAIDASGTVRAGLTLSEAPIAEAEFVWDALRRPDGSTLLATGNEAKLLEYKNGVAKVVAKADAISLTSVEPGFDGAIFAGAVPGSTVLRLAGNKFEPFAELEGADHILALAFDAATQSLFVATGPNGKLFRVTRDGKAQVYFDAPEEHIMSLALAGGKVYAGTADKARLYEVSGPGRARVIYDFGVTEVRAIAVAKSGVVYAVANEIKARKFSGDSKKSTASAGSNSQASGSGLLYRFNTDGTFEQLLSDSSHHYVSLALDARDRPYIGTGVGGQLYTVTANRNSVLVAEVPQRQLSAILLGAGEQLVIASDPLVVHTAKSSAGIGATWTSAALDLTRPAQFGSVDWVGEGRVELQGRSGNTAEPDDTWSTWSAPLAEPGKLVAPKGRYLQLRARLLEPRASLKEVSAAYVTDNLRATVTDMSVQTAGEETFHEPDGKVRTSGGPVSVGEGDEVEVTWNVDNPDKDVLRYRLAYQLIGTATWIDMLEPSERLTKTRYQWNTASLPEGRYRVRVEASDELSNPPEQVKRDALVSHVVVVDNTAPRVERLVIEGNRLVGTVTDGLGPIARVEVSVAGSEQWIPLAPTDGIFDEAREEFAISLSSLGFSRPALVAVRVFDQEHNHAVASILLK